MLAIELEFLIGRYFATDFRDETIPEWPPHPDRLFEAMTAAHHDTFGDNDERAALQWFENLGAPAICAGEMGRPDPVVNFVPTNYDASKLRSPHPDQRGKQPRSFPAQAPSTPVVHFIWPNAEPDARIREQLSAILGRVPSLGRACCFIRACLADAVDTPNWVPDDRGHRSLRVFGEGRLEELEKLFQMGQRPSIGGQERYSEGRESKPEPGSVFGEMIVLRRTGGRPLPIEAALTLTTATRKALMFRAEAGGDHALCELLSGHGNHPHCAVAALPFAGHEHADGRLMGIAVVLPRNISPVDRRKLVRLCAGLEVINLKANETLWTVELSGFDLPRVALNPATWMKASTMWASVTPVLLDQFPKRRRAVEQIVAVACERIGLPAPVQIEHGPYSEVPGVSPVPGFRIRRTKDERPRWGVHVKLRFAAPVRGPILIGAGRFFGLGLMKPWKWEELPNEGR
jgi:CRISPR-associated protein Csb2